MKSILIGVFILILVIAGYFLLGNKSNVNGGLDYSPVINPEEFTTEINSPYLSLPAGKKMVYVAETEEGTERIEVLIPGWTREVMGIQTLVFWDRVYLDGELIEDTRDYLAQNSVTGDVWYFGENVDNYEDGEIVDHEGAWLAGVDGALPGVWMKNNPQIGDSYYQEYYVGEAEDRGDVVAFGQEVMVPFGTFTDCVVVFEYSRLFPETANKYHCSEIDGIALEIDLVGGGQTEEQRTELIEVDLGGALNTSLPDAYAAEGVIR